MGKCTRNKCHHRLQNQISGKICLHYWGVRTRNWGNLFYKKRRTEGACRHPVVRMRESAQRPKQSPKRTPKREIASKYSIRHNQSEFRRIHQKPTQKSKKSGAKNGLRSKDEHPWPHRRPDADCTPIAYRRPLRAQWASNRRAIGVGWASTRRRDAPRDNSQRTQERTIDC